MYFQISKNKMCNIQTFRNLNDVKADCNAKKAWKNWWQDAKILTCHNFYGKKKQEKINKKAVLLIDMGKGFVYQI